MEKQHKIRHLDLFSGIGGFALAVDTVWPGSEHIFCDNDPFCQSVLRKHWPNETIYGDIRTITDTASLRFRGREQDKTRQQPSVFGQDVQQVDILTGGFPCQPFSQAGQRKGTEDDRHLWPEMFRVIRLAKPEWVIAENVRGLLTINGGLVFQQVCADLESGGYQVQPFIIPAVAVNAPHRRDRVWIVANSQSGRLSKPGRTRNRGKRFENEISSNTPSEQNRRIQQSGVHTDIGTTNASWHENWLEVATRLCRMDDGLPARLDGFELTKSRHRVERLKSLGNAIVPQVAIEILKAIKSVEKQ